MGLFTNTQLDEINKSAQKSNSTLEKATPRSSSSSMNKQLQESSEAVLEYFQDSKSLLIQDINSLHEYISGCIESGYAGIDTETTGLDRVKDHIVGVSLYYPENEDCYIPIMHIVPLFDEPYRDQLTYEAVSLELQRLADNNVKLIFANADFDLAMIYKDLNVDLNDSCFYDVIIAWRCLKEDEPKNDLKSLYNKYVLKGAGDPKKFTDFFSPKLFPYCKPQIAKLYAGNDAKITYELFRWQLPYLTKSNPKCQKAHLEHIADLVWNIEFPLIKICQTIHRTGAYLDRTTASILNKRYSATLKKETDILADMVQDVIDALPYNPSTKKRPFTSGRDFNPSSPPQVKYLLYEMMMIPKGENGDTGTGKEILNSLNLPITNQILKVRSISTLINSFVKKLPSSTTSDSRIHAQMKQLGAACITGDSIIVTNKGYATLKDVYDATWSEVVGEHIPLHKFYIRDKDAQWSKADSIIKYQDVDTIKIKTEFGLTLEGTPNHPVMVSSYTAKDYSRLSDHGYKKLQTIWDDRYFKNLEDIKVGDYIQIPCNYNSGGSYQETRLNLRPKKKSKHSGVMIPQIYHEEFAEFLGMYHADGASAFRWGTYRISLSNDDPDVYKRFKELAHRLFNVTPCTYKPKMRDNAYETYIHCMQLGELSRVLISGTQNKKIPRAIWKSPQSVINAYIKGMTLDSTVYYDSTGRAAFELSIIDQEDIRLVQMHLMSQGIYGRISYNIVGIHDRHLRLVFNADNYILFRDKIGFIESCKYLETEGCKQYQYTHRRIGDALFVKVTEISKGRNDVYDLYVPDTHSFISNCMISHNTGRLSCADPNLMNIPSHAVDIRHMFRATAATNEIVRCEDDEEGKITVDVSYYDKIKDENDNLISVHDLSIGDLIKLLDENKQPVTKQILSINPDTKDLSRCKMVLSNE